MKRMFSYAARSVGGFLLTSLPLAASAAAPTLNDAPPETIVSQQGAGGVLAIIATVSRWMLGGLVALAVILVILAAFDFLTSEGDEKKVKDAKDKLLYALVAVGVGILAWGIVLLVGQLFDTTL